MQKDRDRNVKNNRGQSLLETILTLPAFLSFIFLFFSFLYIQWWSLHVDFLFREALICENTQDENCLEKANEKVNKKSKWVSARIYQINKNSYVSEFYFLRTLKWQKQYFQNNEL